MVGHSIGPQTFENFCVKYGKRGKQWEGSWMRVSPEKLQASQVRSVVILWQFYLE